MIDNSLEFTLKSNSQTFYESKWKVSHSLLGDMYFSQSVYLILFQITCLSFKSKFTHGINSDIIPLKLLFPRVVCACVYTYSPVCAGGFAWDRFIIVSSKHLFTLFSIDTYWTQCSHFQKEIRLPKCPWMYLFCPHKWSCRHVPLCLEPKPACWSQVGASSL